MKIVFMGTPSFAVESLSALHQSKHEIVGVITATDKPAGRGQKIQYSAVKEYALKQGLNILQPSNLKDEAFITELEALNADLFVVVAFRMLPDVVWTMPAKGTINLHASLLPQYRGAAPINWAIINGEKETGATTFFIEHKIDTGNVIDNFKVKISDDMNAGELHDILMVKGSQLLLNTVNDIEADKVKSKPQEGLIEGELKKAYKIFKETCEIDWDKEATTIHNLIRGLAPYPSAFCTLYINGKPTTAKIYKSQINSEVTLAPGDLYTDRKHNLTVGTKDFAVDILEIQPAGKKKMDIKSFWNGNQNNTISMKP